MIESDIWFMPRVFKKKEEEDVWMPQPEPEYVCTTHYPRALGGEVYIIPHKEMSLDPKRWVTVEAFDGMRIGYWQSLVEFREFS